MKKTLLFILGLIVAFTLDLLVGYTLQSYEYAGVVVIPYVIITLIIIIDKQEKRQNK